MVPPEWPGTAVGMLQKDMTTPGSVYEKARLLEGADDFLSRDPGKTGHTEIC